MIEARSGKFQVLLEPENCRWSRMEAEVERKPLRLLKLEARMVLYEADGANFFYPLAKADNDCNIN